jgi:hypothetical protein
MTAAEVAATVAKAVEEKKASAIVKHLFEVLPKSAHGKIVDLEIWINGLVDDSYDAGQSVGQHVGVSPLDKRAVADTVKAYGLELDLDSAGLAVRISTPYEFVA